jgi:hypothetical protein
MIAPDKSKVGKGVVNVRIPSLGNVKEKPVKVKPNVVHIPNPRRNYDFKQIVKPDIKFGYVDPLSKDYRAPFMTTGISNTNPMNMALSCKVLNVSNYSAPPIDGSNTQQVIQGYARGQPRGLAYTRGHPLTGRVLNMPSNFWGTMPNPINP